MKWHRIWAMVVRYMLTWIRNLHNFLDDILWPILDIILWGMTSMWMQDQQQGSLSSNILVLLSCLVFWYVVQRAHDAVSMNALEELWDRNFINLFSTPLTIFEWMSAIIILSFFRIFYTLFICIAMVWFLYSCNIFSSGLMLLPFLFSLLLSGLFIGFFTTAFVMYWGRKALFFSWTVSWIFSPFSSVYYPLESLPKWGQYIGKLMPMTYAFEGLRTIVTHHHFPMDYLLISIVLNIIYVILSMMFFVFMFEQSRIKGFTSLQ
ncbi:ABC transporter permease [Candidatus Dependentiae bacterium]|nr:ABC transporter permease [Candidatus Dependentiae bacterium]